MYIKRRKIKIKGKKVAYVKMGYIALHELRFLKINTGESTAFTSKVGVLWIELYIIAYRRDG